MVLCLPSLSHRVWVYSLNRSVVVPRAMVIGKCTDMYSELFSFYFRNAMMHGLDAPVKVPRTSPFGSPLPAPVSAPPVALAPIGATGRPRAKTPLVAVLLDFDAAEHDGAFRAMSRTFGGSPADFHGRSIGCRVHFIGFFAEKVRERHPPPSFAVGRGAAGLAASGRDDGGGGSSQCPQRHCQCCGGDQAGGSF